LWDWFTDLSARFLRIRDGVCAPIPPSEFVAWAQITGNIVTIREFEILSKMERAYCDETNLEIAAYRERQKNAKHR
jgi:hypothetical protein